MSDLEVASSNDDKPVPVEVKMVVWVKRQGWLEEYGRPDGDFEDLVQDWFVSECETIRDLGEWPNVTEVTN